MREHAGRGSFWGRLRRGVGGLAAALVVAAVVVDIPTPVTAAPAQTAGPEIALSPSSDLTDGTPVTISATGLLPGEGYSVYQCRAEAVGTSGNCDNSDGDWGEADADGELDLTLHVDAMMTVGWDQPETIDCRTAEACIVGLLPNLGEDEGFVATAALDFDPAAPLAPPPTIAVSPDSGLVHGQAVTVEGSGLVWQRYAMVLQCATGATSSSDCDSDSRRNPILEDGSFTETFPVTAEIYLFDAETTVDCRLPGACVMVATTSFAFDPARMATAELVFDPDGPLPDPPTVTVTPATDLVDGQVVNAQGDGFTPDRNVGVYQCSGEAVRENCEPITSGESAEDGTVALDVALDALINTGTEVDCRRADSDCSLVVADGWSFAPSRLAQADLDFDPDGPLRPPPALTATPSTGLVAGTTVSIASSGWTPGGDEVQVGLCAAHFEFDCDTNTARSLQPDADGNLTAEIEVATSFETDSGDTVDCLVAPGCVIAASDWSGETSATVPLQFADERPARRYFNQVFDEVDVTHDVVYRDTIDSQGRPIQLKMDIYQPAGDTAAQRPAIMWMHGGYFVFGDKSGMADYAREAAHRGYVGISLQYRLRPEMPLGPPWTEEFFDAARDAYDDALAGVDWLKAHAADYRIDPRAIVAGGYSAGGVTSFNLAYYPGQRGPATSPIAAALPIAGGGSLGTADPGEPPVRTFHGTVDGLVPFPLAEYACHKAQEVGLRCDLVGYEGVGHEVVSSRRHDIMRRSMDFLAGTVLTPLGYFGPSDPGAPTTTTPTTAPGDSGGSGGSGDGSTTTTDSGGGGNLPTTGSNSLPLVWLGLGLASGGGALAYIARRRLAARP